VGAIDGSTVGFAEGNDDKDGEKDPNLVGIVVGRSEGILVGTMLGEKDGPALGLWLVGGDDGLSLGATVG